MIVWGGWQGSGMYLNSGGRYNPSTDSWTATTTSNAPDARIGPSAVWTGSEMIVWGGSFFDGTFHYFNTGGKYNPITNSWTATSTTIAPAAREGHTAVWSGSEMIIWGGGFDERLRTRRKVQPHHRQLDSNQHHQRARWTIFSHSGLDQ